MSQKPEPKEAARQLCEELAAIGLKLPYQNALDIVARLEGYADWRTYLSQTGNNGALYHLNVAYLTGFAEKGYWWTRAEAEPWLVGEQGNDFDGPYASEELATRKGQERHPRAVVVPYSPFQSAAPSAAWEQVSVFARVRIYVPQSGQVIRVMQNPGGDEWRAMNDHFVFEPRYAQKNGRVVGVSWRSPLKFGHVDAVRRKACFDFDARIEFSKPGGLDLKQLLGAMTFASHFSDDWEETETELLSWQ